MLSKTKTALAAVFFFASASAVLATTNNQTEHHSSVAGRVGSVTMSYSRTATVNAGKPFTVEKKTWFAAPQLAVAQSAPVCRPGITDRRMAWIKLTAPGGKLVHINVEQIISVRSDTQIPGAQAQLDFASGKLQGVQENVDEVMQLISATAATLTNDECA